MNALFSSVAYLVSNRSTGKPVCPNQLQLPNSKRLKVVKPDLTFRKTEAQVIVISF